MNNFKYIHGFLAAIRFLTIIPVPGQLGTAEDDLAKSLLFFPLVGLLIGAVTGGVFYLVGPYLPMPLAVVLAVFMLMGFSGGLHLDGVADCGDGFFSSRPRTEMLEIMRDSRIGTMGVAAILLIVALKGAALISVTQGELWLLLVLMPIAGRCNMVLMMAVLPYARKEGGLASVFYGKNAALAAVWSVSFLLTCSWFIAGIVGIMVAVGSLIVLLAFSFYCHRKIGGATGDTLGAASEVSEAAIAVLSCVLLDLGI